MTERIIASRHRSVKRSGTETLHITAQVTHLQGNAEPYFSVTADLEDRKYGRASENFIVGGGCMHEDILRLAPEFAPAVALHLADVNGIPMHAVANGWYWAGGIAEMRRTGGSYGQPDVPNAPLLAKHLRIPLADAELIVSSVVEGSMTKEKFTVMVIGHQSRWYNEAKAVIEWMLEGRVK